MLILPIFARRHIKEDREMKGKLLLLLTAFSLYVGGLQAQEKEEGVDFLEGKTFAEALELARERSSLPESPHPLL